MESWRLSAQDVWRISDYDMRDLKTPIDGDVAQMSVPRLHRIHLVESCRYKALKLLQVEDNNAIWRNLGCDLQVRSSREVVQPRAFGRRQPFFEHVSHSLQSCVHGSVLKQRKALELRNGKNLSVNESLRGQDSRGATSRWASKRRGSFLRRGAFVQKHFSSCFPRALAGCGCRMRPRSEGIRVLASGHRASVKNCQRHRSDEQR